MEKKKKGASKNALSLTKKVLDPDPAPDPHQLEKWDPEPHQNVLDPPHCFEENIGKNL